MSTEFFNDQWRIPSNENQNKVSNYSMSFDGSSDLIDCGNDSILSPTSQLSVSAWVNNTGAGSGSFPCIISNVSSSSNNGGFALVKHLNKWKFYLDTTGSSGWATVESNGTVVSNSWQHLCVTWDGSTVIMYLNGEAQATTASASKIIYNADTETIIGEYAAGYFQGKIDQVTIFDYELPATGTNSVATLYGGGTAVTNPMSLSPKPIAYYQLGDQSVDNGANYLVPNNSLNDYVFNFDGNNDYIGLGTNPFSFTQNLTVSFWLKTSQTALNSFIGKDSNVVTNGRNWMIYQNNNKVNFWTTSSGSTSNLKIIVSNTSVNDNQWHHIVCVNDYVNATKQIYIDGSLDITNNNGGAISTSSTSVRMGNRDIGTGYPYDGLMSNVALWSTALTASQVETIYNNGTPNDISSLSPLSWYKLNDADTFDGSDWTIKDYGSGSNDGTSSGMTSANLVISNLQQASGYSPYALDFDGVDDYLDCGNITALNSQSAFSTSSWFKCTTPLSNSPVILNGGSSGTNLFYIQIRTSTSIRYNSAGTNKDTTVSNIADGSWHHFATVHDGTILHIYLDGVKQNSYTITAPTSEIGNNFIIGRYTLASLSFFNGELSNAAVWNTGLSSSEINEIYNEGVPGNLHNFSGTTPVSWWQLGSNSSYNSGAWTCLDEIGTNNALSAGSMTNNDIVDGPGYSASGLGTSSIDIKGDAPYSSANGLSNSMDVLDRSTDIPS